MHTKVECNGTQPFYVRNEMKNEKLSLLKVSKQLQQNEKRIKEILKDCDDVNYRILCVGAFGDEKKQIEALAVFTEATTKNLNFSETAFAKRMQEYMQDQNKNLDRWIRQGGFGLIDAAILDTFEDVVNGFFSGDMILFIDSVSCALKIADKGYPGLGVTEANSEKGIRGSDESFSDSVKANAALLRKRIRSADLKVKEYKVGVRSHTNVYLIYMEGIARKDHIKEIEKRLHAYRIDRVLNSGVEQQLMMERENSPFPQIQSTRRPSYAAEELLEGRLVLAFDNSPEVLLFPTVYQNFLMAADDSYLQYLVVAMIRIFRYMASILAMILPGIYIVACTFENQLLPTDLMLAIIRSSMDTPFRAVTQILFMEIAFELLREAGVRMPGDMGNAIGIVGGLIIGTAAVDAALVSPIVVIVVAFTALCSFSIPSEELNQAFRLVKFLFIILCALLGEVGLLFGLIAVSLHLAGLTSINQPFLAKVQPSLRKTMRRTRLRSAFVDEKNKVRLKEKR